MNRRDAITVLSAAALAASSGRVWADESTGYAINDTELFQMLDYGANPALAVVQVSAAAGDYIAAKKSLAEYLRKRTTVPWDILPQVSDRTKVIWNEQAAEEAVRGEVVVVAVPHTFPDGNIDWFFNATGGASGLPPNKEWVWQLNRMGWWGQLARGYRATGDEKYADAWVKQLRSWVAQCPPPAKAANGAGSAWRTIECGIRASGILPTVYQTFLLSPSVADDDLISLVRLIVEHGKYLNAFHTGGNWLTMEMNGLYSAGALFPELRDASAWRKKAADALYEQQNIQFLPDGAQYELSPGYHNVALDNVLQIYLRAVQAGRTAELPAGYATGMQRAFDYDLYLSTPDRSLPKFNDSWPFDVPAQMRKAAGLFPARPDFAWMATDGAQGTAPATASHAFDYAGYYVMRDGWGRDACMGILDAGPLGNGHYHQDKLNFVLWSHGRELLYDCGGGSYESSPYRAYATDTFGHNCILVDGKPQRRDTRQAADRVSTKPINARWSTAATHDYAEGFYNEGWGTITDRIATHIRRVLFVKASDRLPAFFLVSDLLQPADTASHIYQARWNLLTVNTGTEPLTQATTTTDAAMPNLTIVPLRTTSLTTRTASAETKPEILGWNVRKDLDPQYVPATTLLHTLQGAGPQRFLTLLVPLKPGASTPVQSIETMAGQDRFVIHLTDGRQIAINDTADQLAAGGL